MKRIVIYDSGVGGLSILNEVRAQIPDAEYIFLSDNAAFPYGTKPEDELLDRVLLVAAAVIDHFNPDLIVVACNTASTLALSALRKSFSTPFVGVVPAIKPAAEITRTGSIAVLATPATVARPYTKSLVDDFAKHRSVSLIAAPELVQLAEMKLRGETIDPGIIKKCLEPIIADAQIDVVVLACTHFPLLLDELKQCLNESVSRRIEIIDSGAAVARRAKHVLATINDDEIKAGEQYLEVDEAGYDSPSNIVLFTKTPVLSEIFLAYLEKLKFTQIQQLDI